MPNIGSVWVGQDVDLYFFGYNPFTNSYVNLLNSYLFDYNADAHRSLLRPCYTNKVQISANLEMNRRQVTGRATQKIVQDNFTYTLTAENLYHNPNQFNEMLQRRNKDADLTIVIFMHSTTREFPYCFEQKILKRSCLNTSSLQFSDNENCIDSVTFWAEELITPATCPPAAVIS